MTTFSDRHQIEEYIASLVTSGAIVEIGCGFGQGLCALWRGHRVDVPIFGIDPYDDYRDLLGGHYNRTTEPLMRNNTAHFEFVHIKQPALEAVKAWSQPIGLLWVDLSMPYEKLKPIVDAWAAHVIPGGYVAITGLCYDQLGTRRVASELVGYSTELQEQNLVAVLKKNEPAKRAAFYISNVPGFINEAELSSDSVKRQLGLETFLFTPIERPIPKGLHFDHVIKLPPKCYSGWYRNSVWYTIQVTEILKDYKQLLYLDVDTYICRNCSTIWNILDNGYDLAMGHAAGRGATPTAVNCAPEFATLGVGVNFFNNTPKVRDFFGEWLRQFEAHYDTYGETDEGPLRDLLYLNQHAISYYVLAPEEHCRFGFGVWLNGSVSILHGRVDKPLSVIAEEINRVTSMRLYRYNGSDNNMLWYHEAK